ncbi:MAG: ATP-binding protein [Magnetospirillum sp.]|nr:ATP-binding protein [Magnetospirillum sp.]
MGRFRFDELTEAALVFAFGLAVCAWLAWYGVEKYAESRADAIAAANMVAGELTDALEAQLALRVRIADMALSRVARRGRPDEVCAGQILGASALADIAREFALPSLLAVSDARGRVICADRPLPSTDVSIEDRGYFDDLKRDATVEIAFGAPVRGRVSGDPAIPVARRLTDEDGRFAGVVLTTMPVRILADAFEAVRPKPGGSVTLYDDKKRLLARAPMDDALVGRNAGRAALWDHYPAADRGNYEAQAAATDGVRRIVTYSRVADYPLVVAVAVSESDTLADVTRRAATERLLLAAVAALILSFCFLLAWRLHSLRLTRGAERQARLDADLQRQAAIEQARTSRRMALVAENTGNLVVVANAEGRIEWVNASFERATGWRLAEVLGRKPGDFLTGPGTDKATSAAIGRALRERRPIDGVEILNYAKDGQPYWLRLEIHPVFEADGAFSGFVAVEEDTTERRAKEAKIRELSERIELATSGAGVGIWTIDVATRRTTWDATTLELLDLAPGDDGRAKEAFASRVLPQDFVRFQVKLQALVREGEDLDGEFRIATRTGARRHLQAKGSAQRDAAGRIVRVHGTIWDITRAKAVEASLREARKRAEDASRAKSDFLAMMSHELRTPLNAIIGFSEMIEGQYLGPVGDPRYLTYAGDIRQSGHLLLGLISGVLDLNKIEVGDWDNGMRPTDLGEILGEVHAIMAEMTTRAGHKLEIAAEPAATIEADPLLIKQLVLNLVSNAAKYTDRGGTIRLSVARRTDGAMELRVEDNGLGMRQDDVKRAVEPFVRLHRDERSDIPGLGIGLSVVKRIVDLHGAKLDIESAPGRGTVVRVAFPAPMAIEKLPTLGPA